MTLVAAGCGSSDDDSSTTGSAESPAAKDTPAGKDTSVDMTKKPTVEVPKSPPPQELFKSDVVEGDGGTAEAGSEVTVHYVGVSYKTGKQFDASWDRNEPFTFQLGGGQVIPGWDQGVEGMKVGGRRVLVIPPDLAYGAAGAPPSIAPNETLVFLIDLLEVG